MREESQIRVQINCSTQTRHLTLFIYFNAVCCDIIQLCIDCCLYYALNITDPSACWVLGFGLSIIFRHSFHRYLVFGAYVGGYWNSLKRMYAGYSIIIVISTVFNIVMTQTFHFSHYTAWISTLLWTGIVNYFILKHIWSFGGPTRTSDKNNASIGTSSNGQRSISANRSSKEVV